MTKRVRLLSEFRSKLLDANRDLIRLKLSLRETFSDEIETVRSILRKNPFLTVGFSFIVGLFFGGLLQARISRFVMLSLLGGFPLAIVYGSSQGMPSILSIGSVIVIDSFVSYSLLKLLRVLEEYSRIQPYLNRIKVRYSDSSQRFVTYSGRLGVQGALAVCTFLIGWWITIVIAHVMDLDTRTSMFSIFAGLIAGGLLSWAIYEGFVRLIPDPAIVVVVFLALFIVTGFVLGKVFRRMGET